MCGRYTLVDWDEVPARFEVEPGLSELRPRFQHRPRTDDVCCGRRPQRAHASPHAVGIRPRVIQVETRPATANQREV